MIDEQHMRRCLELAKKSLSEGEVPVGSVIARGEQILAEGTERTRALLDPSAHAELGAIQAACQLLQTADLGGLTMYSTVEPCVLCAYVVRRAGLSRVVFGIPAGQAGGYSSPYALLTDASLRGWPPLPDVVSGVLAAECERLDAVVLQESSLDRRLPVGRGKWGCAPQSQAVKWMEGRQFQDGIQF
jgi:tRNA(adenine34) deaminase